MDFDSTLIAPSSAHVVCEAQVDGETIKFHVVEPWISPILLTAPQAAAYLQLSESQLALWRRNGQEPPVRRFSDGPSASARYYVPDVNRWIESLTTKAPKAANRKPPEPPKRTRKR